ncbi:unnamed protein product [Caenorhabditis nigoni]
MDESSAVLKNNHHYLKTCILFEVLEKKPIFNAYRSFCNAVGQDVMEYPDFEFWYYRFYHGQRDFDYDRSADPAPKTIMDIPVSLLYKITGNLDPVERTYLRSMNKSIKEVVDSHAPSFETIVITVFEDSMTWKLNDKTFTCQDQGSTCTLSTPLNPGVKYDEYYLKKGLEHLSPILRMTGIQTNHLSLRIRKQSSYLNDLFPVPFHTKSVDIFVTEANQNFPFLSALNPGELETIILNPWRIYNIVDIQRAQQRFFETEQFKQAKHVELKSLVNQEDLVRFSHLKRFKLELDFRKELDFPRIREIISTFEGLEKCHLSIDKFGNRESFRTIGQALEVEIPFGPMLKTITHRYQIPESNEYLHFEIEDEKYSYCTIRIVKVR